MEERVAYGLWGGKTLTVVCAYTPNSSLEYSAFLETLNRVLYRAPVGESIGLQEDLKKWEMTGTPGAV